MSENLKCGVKVHEMFHHRLYKTDGHTHCVVPNGLCTPVLKLWHSGHRHLGLLKPEVTVFEREGGSDSQAVSFWPWLHFSVLEVVA